MRAKAKRVSMWAAGIAALFAAGMILGGSRAGVSAQTEVHLQGRYVLIDKSTETNPRHYLMFDSQNGVLREWTGDPASEVFSYEFQSPREIKVGSTAIRR